MHLKDGFYGPFLKNETKNINNYNNLFASYTSTLLSFHISFNNQGLAVNVKRTESVKYMGVVIDQHLNWDKHINKLSKTLMHLSKFLKQLCLLLVMGRKFQRFSCIFAQYYIKLQ